jgi:hypothetical protein
MIESARRVRVRRRRERGQQEQEEGRRSHRCRRDGGRL